jgi:hypothetical protein
LHFTRLLEVRTPRISVNLLNQRVSSSTISLKNYQVFFHWVCLTTVGVAFPQSSLQVDPLLRYTTETLSVPKLFSVAQPGEKQEREFLGVKSHESLQPPSQAPGKRLDFFLQGLAIGGSGLLLLTSATLAFSGWGIWKFMKR